MRKQTRHTNIPPKVKMAVAERDSCQGWPCCIGCGKPAPAETAWSNAHFIPRSHGGLGVEQNILTLCPECHRKYDQTTERKEMRIFFREYLMQRYPGWNEESLIYRKGDA